MKRLLLFVICQMIFDCAIVCGQSAKSDSLYAKGVELYNSGRYKEAVPFFEESDKLDKAELDSISNRRNYSAMWLASCYYKLNNENLAQSYYEHYKEIPVDRRKTIVSDSLSELGVQYFSEKKYQEALECLNKCAEIEEIATGKDSWFLSNTLYYLGLVSTNLKLNHKAVEYFKRVVDIYRFKEYDLEPSFVALLNQLALSYNSIQDYENAVNTIEEAAAIAKKIYGENSYNYALVLSNAGLCYRAARNYNQAVSAYRISCDILKSWKDSDFTYFSIRQKEADCLLRNEQYKDASLIFKELLPAYIDKYGKISGEHLYIIEELQTAIKKIGKYEEALKLCDESISLRLELFGKSGIGLAVQYREQADNNVALKRFKDAITSASKSAETYKITKGEQDEYYASALAYLGYCYSYDKQYDKAIEIVKQAIEIRRKTIGEDNPNFITTVLNLGTYYKEIYQFEKAIECGKFVVAQRKKIYGEKHIEYARGLSWLANFYNGAGNYEEAVELEEQACEIFYSTNAPYYLTSLASLASIYSNYGNYLKAVELGKQSLIVCKETLGDRCGSYVTILENLGKFYSDYGNNKEAIKLSENALEISTNLFGENSLENASIQNRMSDYYQQSGNYRSAFLFAQKALAIREKHRDSHPIEYASSLGALSVVYDQLGSYKEADSCALLELQTLRNIIGRNHPKYMKSLGNYVQILLNKGDFQKASEVEDVVLEICKKIYGEDNVVYFEMLEHKATLYGTMLKTNDAIVIYKSISDYCVNHLSPNHPLYLRNQRNLAQALLDKGNFTESRNILISIEPLIVKAFGKLHPIYSEYLSSMSKFYEIIGNYQFAIDLLHEKIAIDKELSGDNQGLYANSLNNLATCFFRMNDCQSAIDCSKNALQIIENLYGKEDYRYAISLSNLCAFYYAIHETEQSIKYGESALELLYKNSGEENTLYATVLNNLAMSYTIMGNTRKAIDLTKRSLGIRSKMLGESNYNCIFLYQILSSQYASINDTVNVLKCEKEFISKFGKHILNTFTYLTSKERESFWNQYSPYFNLSCMASYKFGKSEFNKIAYNSILLSKGLLLTTDTEMEKMLKESNDTSALKLYWQIKDNYVLLNHQYQIPISSRYIDVDSLESVIRKQNIELVNRSRAFGDFTKNIQVKWEDVRNALSPGEIAIEFEKIPAQNDMLYLAYLISYNCEYPIMIPLCNEQKIRKNKNQGNILCKSIWEPLVNEIKDAKTIFFAPSGELYNIPIESIPHWDEECIMSDKWNMYRLSSTRQLTTKRQKEILTSASVFGGIKYDTDSTLLITDSQKYRMSRREIEVGEFVVDSIDLRGGVAYLPATKTEANDIDKALGERHINTILMLDTLATEGAFKDLSGKNLSLLHIATHGFYWTEKEAKYRDNLGFLMFNENQKKYDEDKALVRSGLLLAGANYALMGKKLPEGVDDGILTAKEISQLDLRGLDLVVLSACQTGLGEIKGDGVFGLQRGFKKAGANSLLMSLWKVDDDATRLLMTQFYKNLTSGMSKYESLKQAQKYVREYETEVEMKSDARPSVSAHAKEQAQQNATREKTCKKTKKYQDPYYWAAFILLDALN